MKITHVDEWSHEMWQILHRHMWSLISQSPTEHCAHVETTSNFIY